MSNNLAFLNAFKLIPSIGSARLKKIIFHFKSPEEAWGADEMEFEKADLEKSVIFEIIEKRKNINPEKEFDKLLRENINIITIKDKSYPYWLKEIYDAPSLLYIRGEIKPQDRLSIAVVGSRKPTPYGRQITPCLVADLTRNGVTIISGLAYGIDALAHETALKMGGRTIAVLGSGLDSQSIYPPTNKKLAEEIIENGAILSEYPFGAPAFKQNFPARNRIVSGLSLGTLVIEAMEKSGALITAEHALSQNREVFAVPGSIYNLYSAGPNNLIKKGAKLILNYQDIFEELNLDPIVKVNPTAKFNPETNEEKIIFENLSNEPTHIDKIIILSKLDAATVNATLAVMEINGLIKNIGGMNYIKN